MILSFLLLLLFSLATLNLLLFMSSSQLGTFDDIWKYLVNIAGGRA